MTRLIDADALLEYFEDNSNGDYTEWFLENIEDAIKDAPTVQREGWIEDLKSRMHMCCEHAADYEAPKQIPDGWKLIGKVSEMGVVWHKQNPHAHPVGTEFYAVTPTNTEVGE